MSNEKDVTAFPSDRIGCVGMTLRDYFAAKAMQSLLANSSGPEFLVSEWAYKIADSMLEARK